MVGWLKREEKLREENNKREEKKIVLGGGFAPAQRLLAPPAERGVARARMRGRHLSVGLSAAPQMSAAGRICTFVALSSGSFTDCSV